MQRSAWWLRFGEWLLKRRWWWISLATLSVFTFEFMEYHPFQQGRGIELSFIFEISFYGLILPASTGLALTALARSRTELAWSLYYQNLKHNLEQQLHHANSHSELASTIVQFLKVVLPLVGIEMYKYDPNATSYQAVLNWSANPDLTVSNSISECSAQGCPCLVAHSGNEAMTLHACRDDRATTSSYCIPFSFSNSPVASARLYFSADGMPSPEHTHLLEEVAIEVASAFHRVQLQRLIKTRDESINTEQQRIARDVHDTLGHSLAYLRLRLDQISLELNHNGTNSFQQEVTILRDVAKEAYEQMRDMLITLSPNTNQNLNDILEKYAARISTRANFELSIRHYGKPRALSPPVQRNVINIFREILTNIENHAHARQVALDLNWEKQYFEVKVKDNGVGFDPALPVEFGHFGLSNMRERSKESHIEFFLASQVGDGTQLTLRVPFEGEL